MKILTITTLFFTCFLNPIMGQWTSINTGTTQQLNDLIFIDADTAFCIGENGLILKSVNGGLAWTEVYQNPGLSFQSIAQNSAGTLLAKGQKSESVLFLAHSTDMGITWQVDSTSYAYLGAADNRIQAAGNTFFFIQGFDYTLMSGIPGNFQAVRQQTYAFDFQSPLAGYILLDNYNMVEKTTDGGTTWVAKSNNLNQAMISNNQIIYGIKLSAAGSLSCFWYDYPPGMLISLDGGSNFSKYQVDARNYIPVSNSQLIATGHAGIVLFDFSANTQDTLVSNGFVGKNITLRPDSAVFSCGMNGELFFLPSLGQITGTNAKMGDQPEITIHPNPAKSEIKIRLPKHLRPDTVLITNLEGKTIQQYAGNKRTLDISGLSAGTYWLVIRENGNQMSRKFIIQQ